MTSRHPYLSPNEMEDSSLYEKMYCHVDGITLTRESGIFENQTNEKYKDVTWIVATKKLGGMHSVRMVRDIGGIGYLYTIYVKHIHFPPKNVKTTYKFWRF